jgi:hypothetical protein
MASLIFRISRTGSLLQRHVVTVEPGLSRVKP